MTKVNFGTYLKQRYLHAVRQAIGYDCPDPHRLLGMGGREDVLMAGPPGGARRRPRADRPAGMPRKGNTRMNRDHAKWNRSRPAARG